MKTLVVTYLPRGERSHTKKLVDAFLEATEGQEVEHLDLLKNIPDFFTEKNLMAYIQRNYLGNELNADQQAAIAKMDTMTEQFLNADNIVVAFPMYNFSQPAMVKAYFDSILLKGKTWDMDENGFKGLLPDKKALILMASGGIYEGDTAGFEHAMTLTQGLFQFMGFKDIQHVASRGMNMLKEDELATVEKKNTEQVQSIAKQWFN